MSVFEPRKRHLQEILLYFFSMKKSAIESHRLLVEDYDDTALSKTTRLDWFRRFQRFHVENKEPAGRPKLVEYAELETLLDENPCQMQKELAESLGVTQSTIFMCLKTLGMIQK